MKIFWKLSNSLNLRKGIYRWYQEDVLQDCEPLLKKIRRENNSLGYQVLVLYRQATINSSMLVLFCLNAYQCRHFLLPKGVIELVNRLCASFLWHGSVVQCRECYREHVCLPKCEGGLGLKNLFAWNLRHALWILLLESSSL